MESNKTIISSTPREFEEKFNNFLVDNYGIKTKPENEFGEKKLTYIYNGSLILCKITPIKNKVLEVEIKVSHNSNETLEKHVEEILKKINKLFRPADFPFGFKRLITNEKHYEMMEKLLDESYKTQEAKAHLSTIVLIGSILEGILYFQITKNENNMRVAGSWEKAPKDKRGNVLPFEKWSLKDMIDVSYWCGWINKYYYDYSNSLREHRNFVHPFLQLGEMFSMPNDNSCDLSRVVLKGVFDNILEITES